jgi:Ca-activated chloride channel family protein
MGPLQRPVRRGKQLAPQRNVAQIRALLNVFAIVVAVTLTVVGASAQLGTQDQTLFRGRTDLVSVGVTVAAKRHQFITHLTASDFAVYEDGRPQQIFAFASGAQAGPPLHVGVLLDVSGSQGLDLEFTQNAVIKFLASVSDPADVTFIDFASHVRAGRYAPSDIPRLLRRIRDLSAGGETSLYDAIGLYLDGASGQDGRKVMVVYTDGADNHSSLTFEQLMTLLKASDATVYAIGALEQQPQSVRSTQRALLERISEVTGGSAFFPGSAKDLNKIYEQVIGEIQAQYTIGYVSSNEKTDGAWRKVEVKITCPDSKGMRVRARKGYYAPLAPAASAR